MGFLALIPPKSAWAGGLAGLATYFLMSSLQAHGVNVDSFLPTVNAVLSFSGASPVDHAGLQTLVSGGVGTAISWVVGRVFPPSYTNIALHADSVIKTLAKIEVDRLDTPKPSPR